MRPRRLERRAPASGTLTQYDSRPNCQEFIQAVEMQLASMADRDPRTALRTAVHYYCGHPDRLA